MIWTFVKKQILLLLARPRELLILLVMPLVLIAILSFSLRSFISGESEALYAKVAFVENSDVEKELATFKREVAGMDLPEEAKVQIIAQAESLLPVKILKEEVLGSEELREHIEYAVFSPTVLDELRRSGQYIAIIIVPENFHYNTLMNIFFQEKNDATLTVLKNGDENYTVHMVDDLLNTFQSHYTILTLGGQYGVHFEQGGLGEEIIGAISMLDDKEPIESFHYYTATMSVMFVLFIAPFMSNILFTEKRTLVYERIILANGTRWYYFSGTFIATLILAFFQQLILYGICSIAFQIHFSDLIAFLILCFSLSVAVAGIASLLTAITFFIDSQTVANFFISFVVMVMAYLGGSFVPVYSLGPIIRRVGDFTPNGAALETMLKLMQGYGLEVVKESVLYLMLLGLITAIVAAICFPKRRMGT